MRRPPRPRRGASRLRAGGDRRPAARSRRTRPARIGGWRELAREVDQLARDAGAAFVITRGYAATSLLTYYGDPALRVVERDQRERWLFEDAPPEALFAAPGLAFGEADRGFAAELAPHFAEVEEIARLVRRPHGRSTETYVVYRVADPIPPVLGGE